ncbi:hypothetical protein EHI8A_212460 [Entamoeba histolytica HM-1:IMSS-B]|uniref:Rhodanese domain-containing protein n=5 Tax=Entamoeba histolytica TaxID=5759 RepID=A0A175JW48_ENTHI|nr:hypothetical protein EHI8A_212460 [Entamoeba histolytica HM-1:IMSS-B]EMS15942.1 hypothetical protein KM1_280510 [Entamoeba histolytica HM-3:IMSS]ENY61936.1 hypothetical protein EHI7A_183060 [Entamoeba histolytica HM-1:IMSS-A]GAT98010.1 hypothetical protein CL6EHI_181530B [Entamoeba histolytica]
MEEANIKLISKCVQLNSLNDIRTLCRSQIPSSLRSSIYKLFLQPKRLVKEIKSSEHHVEEIKTLVQVKGEIIWPIVDTIITRYTIAPTSKNLENLYRVISTLYSLNSFELTTENSQEQIQLANLSIAFFERFHRYFLTHYPSIQTALNTIFLQLLLFHCPSLAIKLESKRINISNITSPFIYNLFISLFNDLNALWKLWDYLLLSEDPCFFVFILTALFLLKEHTLGDSTEDILQELQKPLSLSEVDLLCSTASFVRSHTPLTVFRYISGSVSFSYNFQRIYSKILKNSNVFEVTATDIIKDMTTRHQLIHFVDCRDDEDFERCSILGSQHITLPVTSETITDITKDFKPNHIIVLFGSQHKGHLPTKDMIVSAALAFLKIGVEKVCIMESGFEGYHECAMNKVQGAKLERHNIALCYVCNPQIKKMEKIASVVEENAKKAKETVQEKSSSWWGYISQTVSDAAKKYEQNSIKAMEDAKRVREEERKKQKEEQNKREEQSKREKEQKEEKIKEEKKEEPNEQKQTKDFPKKIDQKEETSPIKKEDKKMELFEIVEEDDDDEKDTNNTDYFNDVMKENPTYQALLEIKGDQETKNILVVLTSIELLILEKSENEVFMVQEILYDDIKKVITKRSTPENITIKTQDEELIMKITDNHQQFIKDLTERTKK